MERLKKVGLFILTISVIPVIGLIVSGLVTLDFNKMTAAANLPPLAEICAMRASNPKLSKDKDVAAVCGPSDYIMLLKDVSIDVLVGSSVLPFVYMVVAALGRGRRVILSVMFPVLMPLTIIILSASVLIQAGIFSYSIYVGEGYLIGYVQPKLIFTVGLA